MSSLHVLNRQVGICAYVVELGAKRERRRRRQDSIEWAV